MLLADGVRARKGSSRPGLRLPRGLSGSKRPLPGGERSSGVLGVDAEKPRGGGGAPRAPRRSPGGLPVARPRPSPSSRPPPMMAGSRLRVWRSLRLERLLAAGAAGEEQEKTLLSRLCADIAAAAGPGGVAEGVPAVSRSPVPAAAPPRSLIHI